MKTILMPIVAAVLLLAGCAEEKKSDLSRESREAGQAIKEAAKETGDMAKEVGKEIADKTRKGVGIAADATEKAAKKVKEKVKD
jgi:outer membrane murein-binding lipoprotein Lpp